MVVKRKVRDDRSYARMFYITEDQNKYLLDKSIEMFGQANKKSEVLREILDIAIGDEDRAKEREDRNA